MKVGVSTVVYRTEDNNQGKVNVFYIFNSERIAVS
jgi:predicted RNA binding protein with dsRBD fold (UPF0201 family)